MPIGAMRMVIDHNDSLATGNGSNHAPLSRATIDRPRRMANLDHPLNLNVPELPLVDSGGGVDRPDEAPKADA